jgi:hypothetical protein
MLSRIIKFSRKSEVSLPDFQEWTWHIDVHVRTFMWVKACTFLLSRMYSMGMSQVVGIFIQHSVTFVMSARLFICPHVSVLPPLERFPLNSILDTLRRFLVKLQILSQSVTLREGVWMFYCARLHGGVIKALCSTEMVRGCMSVRL